VEGFFVAKVIVPVGFDGGRLLDHDPNDGAVTGPGFHEVATPTETIGLTLEEYKVWLLSYADPEAASRGAFARSDLESLAVLEMAAIDGAQADAPALIDQLFKYGLLAEFDPEGPSGIEFLKAHRLYPSADGLGESEQDPGYFQIGREGQVLLKLMIEPYVAWLRGPYYRSIWDHMTEFSKESDEESLFGDDLSMQMVAQAIPGIVTNRCGFVQPL
jgi:hypothetical protein